MTQNKHTTELSDTSCLVIICFLLLPVTTFIASFAQFMMKDTCGGTATGANLSMRMCSETGWQYVPYAVHVALLIMIVLVLVKYERMGCLIRIAMIAVYFVLAVALPIYLVRLPFFWERLR